MMFRLYYRSHLYEDAAAGMQSKDYSKKRKMGREETASPVLQPGPLPAGEPGVPEPPPRHPNSPSSSPRSVSPAPDLSSISSSRELPPQNPVGLAPPTPRSGPTLSVPMHQTETAVSDRLDVTLAEGEEHPNPLGQEATPEVTNAKVADAPQISWFMTVAIIAVVSVVRSKYTPHQRWTFRPDPLQLVAGTADWLVVTVNGSSVTRYVSKEWTALILLPTVRAIAGMWVALPSWKSIVTDSSADCVTAVNVSVKDQLTLSSAVGINSTIVSNCFFASWIHNHGFLGSNFLSSSFPSPLSSGG